MSTSPLYLTMGYKDVCPKSNTFRCECKRETRNPVNYYWMSINKDTLKDSYKKGKKPALDTPGFIPLKYQQPM